ncbi:hypothetical protein GW17_00046451 [Ensete ventricosum]|nr:hypothetical protein GW17_00046451 [Ensete ventricosum]
MGCATSSKHGSLREDYALDLKPVISRNSKLSRTVADLLKSVLPGIRNGLADLDICLHHALLGLRTLEAALVCFEEENRKKEKSDYRRSKKRKKPRNGKNAYALTLRKLSEFELQAGAPFIHLDVEELQSALKKLEDMMEALRGRKKEIEERLRSTNWWRKVWNLVFTAVFIGVLVCSVVLAASVAAPVAITAATASATAMKAMELWINSVWDERKKALEDEEEVVKIMRDGGFSLPELESIRSMVHKLRNDYDALNWDVKFMLRQETEEATKVGMTDVRKKIEKGEVTSGVERLKSHVDACATSIQRAEEESLKTFRS